MTEQDFRRNLDAELSDVTWTQGNRYHVLSRLNEGGIPVKKKISTAFALVMALMVLTATAVAATLLWKDAGEKVAPLESQNGYYDTWDAQAKVALVKALFDLDELKDNPDAQRLLTADLTEAEQSDLADQIMTAYVNGAADTVTLASILEKLHGPIESWPMEDRVWYNGLLAENNLLTSEDMPYALPAGEELTQQQAVERATDFLERMGAGDLGTGSVEATMYQEPRDAWTGDTQVGWAGRRVWSVVFRGCGSGTWHADMTADGAVVGYSTPMLQRLYTTGRLPDADAISEAQAIALAKEAAAEQLGLTENELANVRACYGYINHADAGHAPLGTRVWQVVYGDGSHVTLSFDGDVLYAGK